ncbi:MAG: hypothetical protein ACRDRL_27495, partial [Sciscionella sp.]
YSALIAVLRRDPAQSLARSGETIALCEQWGFGMAGQLATCLRGWALAHTGDPETGVTDLRAGIAGLAASGQRQYRPFLLGLLADAHSRAGQPQQGLSALVDALAEADRSGERFYQAELYRLRADIVGTLGPEHQAASRTWRDWASNTATSQGALGFLPATARDASTGGDYPDPATRSSTS